jgi:sucrose-phosphate synthase
MATLTDNKLYIVLVSVHGLIRGHDLELGRDADTGGQTLYVVEQARALAERPDVARVDLLTRLVNDPKVSSDYTVPIEKLSKKANLVRLECGPRRYLRKEVLWPYLDEFVDKALHHIRNVGRLPDVVHGHYADAGLVSARLSNLLGVSMVFTGHSLGRVKKQRLLEKGTKTDRIESQYNITQRIEAEEQSLDIAQLVIASTRQEVDEQYELYDDYVPERMQVIPPGVDLSRFYPPKKGVRNPVVRGELSRFLSRLDKPMILALSRADERKNIATLLRAFGENDDLNNSANLVVIAGNRDDIQTLDKGARNVLTEILMLIDRYDLYGKVAYPKHHTSSDVPVFYRIAANTGGVFINPALTEPFGLTLIEAAASGLPIIATADGGPKDIINHCKNGVLIDPLDADAMGQVLHEAISDKRRWKKWSTAGVRGANRHYSWSGHAESYVKNVKTLVGQTYRHKLRAPGTSRLPTIDRIAVSSIDGALIGDEPGLCALMDRLRSAGQKTGFGVATARNIKNTMKILGEWKLTTPDLLITSLGSHIYYGHGGGRIVEDVSWNTHIDFRWDRNSIIDAMKKFDGIKLLGKAHQSKFRISYSWNKNTGPSKIQVMKYLRQHDLHANVIFTHDKFLDLIPIRASKGQAIRYVAIKWGLPLERFFVAGDSTNDEEMLKGDTLAVVVANHDVALDKLKNNDRIYFATTANAWGVLEGLDYYDFLGKVRVPAPD